MTDVFDVLADLVIIIAGVVMTAAGWHWIANHTWRKWREEHLWKQAAKKTKESEALDREAMQRRAQFAAGAGVLPPLDPLQPQPLPGPQLFVTYQMEDGSHIDEYSFVTELEWFDDRDREVRLIKRTYALVAEELVILPDPYPVEDDE